MIDCEFCNEKREGYTHEVGVKVFEVCDGCIRKVARWIRFILGLDA